MTKLERLEKKVADTKAVYSAAYAVYSAAYAAWVAYRDADNKGALAGAYAAFSHADNKGALAADAYVDATATYVDAGAAYIKARDELEEYKEQDNE
jgi:hypothetical protein